MTGSGRIAEQFHETLARRFSSRAERQGPGDPEGGLILDSSTGRVDIGPPLSRPGQRLEIRVLEEGDVEVAYFVADRKGSPFEQLIVGRESPDEVHERVLEFVGDLLEERLVLAWDRRPLRGGRLFVKPEEIDPRRLRHLDWVVSWQGTHDWTRGRASGPCQRG